MELVIDHTVRGTTLERYLEAYYSDEFNRAAMPLANLRDRQLLSRDVLDDGRIRRRSRLVPDVSLPRAVQALLGEDELAYFEMVEYDPAERTARFWVESDAGERVQVSGTVRFIVDGDSVRRLFQGEVRVQIFGLGKIVERIIVSEAQKRYARVDAFLAEWLGEQRP